MSKEEKAFGRYHDVVVALFSAVLTGLFAWLLYLYQHELQVRERTEDQGRAEVRDSARRQEAAKQDSVNLAFQSYRDSTQRSFADWIRRADSAYRAHEAKEERAFVARQGALAREYEARQQSMALQSQANQHAIDLASSTFDEISKIFDRRLYRSRVLLWGYARRLGPDEIRERRESYVEAVQAWNESLNRNIAIVERSFGRDMKTLLTGPILNEFRCIHTLLYSPSPDTVLVRKRIDSFNPVLVEFNARMLRQIQQGVPAVMQDPSPLGAPIPACPIPLTGPNNPIPSVDDPKELGPRET